MKCKHAFANNDGGEWCDKHHIYELTEMDCKRCKLREEHMEKNLRLVDIDELVARLNKMRVYPTNGMAEAIGSYLYGKNEVINYVVDMLTHLPEIKQEDPKNIALSQKEVVKEPKKEKISEKVAKRKTKTVEEHKKAKRVNTSNIDVSYLVSRKQRGLTYKQLGEEFGISQSTAHRLYNDYINQFNKKGDTK